MLAEVVDAYVVDPVGSLVSSSFIHLPTALCSTSITRFHSSYGSSDSCSGLLPLQVSPLTRTRLCSRSVVNHPIAIPLLAPVLLWDIGFTIRSQARLAIQPNHVHFVVITHFLCYGPVTHLPLLSTCPHGHAVTFGFVDWGVYGLVFHQSGLYASRAHDRRASAPLDSSTTTLSCRRTRKSAVQGAPALVHNGSLTFLSVPTVCHREPEIPDGPTS